MSEETKSLSVIDSVEKQKAITYKSAGQEVTLSRTIVRNYLTKGSENVTDADIVQFISICQFNQLNPFLNEAYLIKYGNQPASMVVSKEAFLKRADACENYDGFQAGIIVLRDKDVIEIEGCFLAPGDTLLGGWAKVYRSDKKFPFVSKVSLTEYDKKQSLWREKPSTMISKIAKAQALREAFPAQLGAMYTTEEQVIDDQTALADEIGAKGNRKEIAIPAEEPAPEPATEPSAEHAEAEAGKPKQNTLGPGF